jgi:transcriptional regulator with XRE-family HTH domain
MIYKRLGECLRLYRNAHNIQQQELSWELGVSKSMLCRMEKGHSFSPENWLKVINWLMEKENGS